MDARSMVVNCNVYRNGVSLGRISIDEIGDALEREGTFVWVGLHDPDPALMREVQREFGLHELAIEDATGDHQRPKVEAYGETLFVVLHTAQDDGTGLRLGETNLFIGQRFVVSVRHGPSDSYARVREQCETQPARLAKGPGFVLYALMDFVVDNYRPIVEGMRTRFSRLEESLFAERFDRGRLEALYELKGQLLRLHAAIAPVSEICGELMRLHADLVPHDTQVYFRDIDDHVRRLVQSLDTMREMVTDAMHVNLALVTVGQNEIVKQLAGWGAILAVPTMVFSLYGMNFRNMPELGWAWGYPMALAVVGVVSVGLFLRFRRAGWL
jgi:magnesium transporter